MILFSILNIYVFINESSLIIGQENLNLINHSSKEAFCVLITVYLFQYAGGFFLYYRDFDIEKAVGKDCFRCVTVVIRIVWRFYLSATGNRDH